MSKSSACVHRRYCALDSRQPYPAHSATCPRRPPGSQNEPPCRLVPVGAAAIAGILGMGMEIDGSDLGEIDHERSLTNAIQGKTLYGGTVIQYNKPQSGMRASKWRTEAAADPRSG